MSGAAFGTGLRPDSNAALLPYFIHQLGSAHEWSGVWNGPNGVTSNGVTRNQVTGKKFHR